MTAARDDSFAARQLIIFKECSQLLRSCTKPKSLSRGKQLHLHCIKIGIDSIMVIANCILQMYLKCDGLRDAQKTFDQMPERNSFSWNSLIEAYAISGMNNVSLRLFRVMPCRNAFSWNLVIAAHAKSGDFEVAQQLFDEMLEKNTFTWNSMIHGCLLHGRIIEARSYFDAMTSRDLASWNKMMTGYVHHGQPLETVKLFQQLRCQQFEVDSFVLATVSRACADLKALDSGKQIHARILINGLEFDSVLGSSMINMYAKCGDVDTAFDIFNIVIGQDDFCSSAMITGFANCGRLEDAYEIFIRRDRENVVSWNSLISGYANNFREKEAIELFNEMRRMGIQTEATTITVTLTACMSLESIQIKTSKQFHALVCKVGYVHNIAVSSSMIALYGKFGCFEDAGKIFDELEVYDTVLMNSMVTAYSNGGQVREAKKVFDSIPCRSLISWNSMIVGYSKNGFVLETLALFHEMQMLNLKLDKISYASIISLCADMSSLELGEQIFARIIPAGLESDPVIGSALIHLYCKCGLVVDSRKLFDSVPKISDVVWNSMLMGYAHNGYGYEALQVFNDMKTSGITPNSVTFIALLSACSHCGLVEEGKQVFNSLSHDYCLSPTVEHCSCMIDLLARAGRLQEAVDFIDNMAFSADASMWTSVLSASRAHGDDVLGKKAADQLLHLDYRNSAAFVQLSNIYATCGKWDEAAQVRKFMHQKGSNKRNPGCSWIDGGNR